MERQTAAFIERMSNAAPATAPLVTVRIAVIGVVVAFATFVWVVTVASAYVAFALDRRLGRGVVPLAGSTSGRIR